MENETERSGQNQIPECFLGNQIPAKKRGTRGFRIFFMGGVLQCESSNLKRPRALVSEGGQVKLDCKTS